jgi:hypothetical protein
MNANELADELEACFTKADWNVLEAATMLRQQQAEIEALKKFYAELEDKYVLLSHTCSAKTLTDEEIIESLAELEHEQWIQWASTIMQTEKISDGRIARWKDCFKPYAELSEEMKEHDRVWAKKALAILRKAQEK